MPEGTRELVFHGARVWPYENETILFEDACNSYRFVAELHGMLQAMLKSDKPGRAIKLRHYAKWMRRLSNPGADMMFRMASAISRNPDKEFEVNPPPLEVSYEESEGARCLLWVPTYRAVEAKDKSGSGSSPKTYAGGGDRPASRARRSPGSGSATGHRLQRQSCPPMISACLVIVLATRSV